MVFVVYLYSLRYFAECIHQQMLLACLAACSLLQRQFLTAKHSQLQEDIFKLVVNIITSTSNFGVQIRRINKVQIVEVTSKPELQQLLHFCLGNKETSLKQEIPGKGNYYWQRETLHCYLQLLKFVITERNNDNVPQFTWHCCWRDIQAQFVLVYVSKTLIWGLKSLPYSIIDGWSSPQLALQIGKFS